MAHPSLLSLFPLLTMTVVILALLALIGSRRARFVAFARIAIGFIFAIYGVVKLTGTQLHHWHSTARLDQLSSSELFWYFFGYSRPYVVVLGVAELVAAVLFVVPRTERLGTLLWIGFGVHITMLDFAYHVGPVSYWVLGLTVCSVSLVLTDAPPYRRALAALVAQKDLA